SRNLEAIKREESQIEKVDFLSVIEKNILKILLNHGSKELTFDNYYDVLNQDGEVERKVDKKTYKVYERVYLNLQDDEMEFSNEKIRTIYNYFISHYHSHESFDKEKFISEIPQQLASEISDLYLADDQYRLDNWESKNIFPKTKDDDSVIIQNVTETILNLRCYLIYELVGELMNKTKDKNSETNNTEI